MCNHSAHLQRQHRTFWHKIMGVKELYVCTKCGHVVKVK